MAEYIEREIATAYAPLPKHLRKYQTMNLDDAWEDGYDYAISQIEALPAADVAPVVRGRWIHEGDSSYRCSVCGEISCCTGNYCPDCGAKMEVTP